MPDRLVLTFDLDGVLCRPPFGINPGSGRNKRRDTPGRKNVLWRTERWRYAFRRPMPGAPVAFRDLAARYDCKVLSARGEAARPLTENWFRRWFGSVPEIHLRGDWHETPAQFKARKVAELGAAAHFEDDPHTAEWLAELLPAVFLVDWGRNRWLTGERVHRVTTIADAAAILPVVLGEAPSDRYSI
ncbi:MAG: hypothetical protein ACM3S1_02735 [Hyphomicrobiales bacterium]